MLQFYFVFKLYLKYILLKKGFIFKPMTGVLDAASKITEGMKNTATESFEKPNEERVRCIRAFYDKQRLYRKYD